MKSKKHHKSSRRWLDEHLSDPYVKQAQREGYRSRAVYKLMFIQEKDHILTPGQVVLDLGAAPGGWSQYAAEIVGSKGHVFAMDVLPIAPLAGVDIIEGDFTTEEIYQKLLAQLAGQEVASVVSDLAPNLSGMNAVDQPRSMLLAELALEFAEQVLIPDGNFVTKCFQGEGFDQFLHDLRQKFRKVVIRKPPASRPRSREVYLVAKELLAKNREKC